MRGVFLKTIPTLIIVAILCLVLFGAWFFFIDTLSFSQLVGRSDDPTTTIMVNLLDFDTDLTRRDVYRLKTKADYWESRMDEVDSISDPQERINAQKVLMAEMMEDPSLKKIIRKVSRFGVDAVKTTMSAVRTFK